MTFSRFFFHSVLVVSLFSFSLSSFASQTRFDLQEENQPFSQSLPVKSVKKHQDDLLIRPDVSHSQPSPSYLSSLRNMTSSAFDSIAKLVIKGYGLYTFVALPFVNAVESNMKSGTTTKTGMMTNSYTKSLKERCFPSFHNPHDCDQFNDSEAEEQYSSLVSRYPFLKSSYLEMEYKVENFLETERKNKGKKSKHKSQKYKSFSKAKGGDCMDVAFFNVGQGNASVVKPSDSSDVWIFDAGSNKNAQNVNDKKTFDKEQIAQVIYNYICSDNANRLAHIVLSHPDQDHYNLIGSIFLNESQNKIKNGCIKSLDFYVSDKYASLKEYFKLSLINPLNELEIFNKYMELKKDDDFKKCLELYDVKDEKKPLIDRLYTIKNCNTLLFNPLKRTTEKKIKELIKMYEQATPKIYLKLISSVFKKDIIKGDFEINFLNEGNLSEQNKTNENSLVVKVNCRGKSVLFTGDATRETYEHNEYVNNPNSVKYLIDPNKIKDVDIYQAAHHGSIESGENDFRLIRTINPKYVVFSAPRIPYRDDWRHPSWQLVDFFDKNMPDKGWPHYLFLDKNIFPMEIFNKENETFVASYKRKEDLEKYYSIYATRRNIFHTGSHGTVIFSINKNKDIDVNTYDYDIPIINQSNFSTKNQINKNIIKIITEDEDELMDMGLNVKKNEDEPLWGLKRNNIKELDKILQHEEQVKGLRPVQKTDLNILNNQKGNIDAIYLNALEKESIKIKKHDKILMIYDEHVKSDVTDIKFIRVSSNQIADKSESGIDKDDFFVQKYFGIDK